MLSITKYRFICFSLQNPCIMCRKDIQFNKMGSKATKA